MNEDEKKTDESEVTPEGAVEVKEEDLDKAAGGAVDAFTPRPDIAPDGVDKTLTDWSGPGDEKVQMQDFHLDPEKRT